MRRLFPLLVLSLLAGCQTYDLPEEFRPLSKIVERPSMEPVVKDRVVFTKGSHVYVHDLDAFLADKPPGSVRFVALMKHEQEHARRQYGYLGLPGEIALAAWLSRYATSPSFMWREERRGWYYEIKHMAQNGQWTYSKTIQTAQSLSGGAYKTIFGERMTNFNGALHWIQEVLTGQWEPE